MDEEKPKEEQTTSASVNEAPAEAVPAGPDESVGSAGPAVATLTPGAGETHRPGLFARLYSKDTRFGRFMRAATRTVATIVSLFALGLLAGYILLYQPTQRQLASTQADLATERSRTGELEGARDDTQAKLDALQKRYDASQAGLDAVTARMHLARLSSSVSLARVALTNRDTTAAEKAFKDAQTEYEAMRPTAEKVDKDGTSAIKLRLDLVVSEYKNNSKLALADLAILSDSLTTLDGEMGK
jgi:hypothetical protein